MQNYWRRVLLRQVTQKIIRVLADAKPKSCVLADAQPKRKPVVYRLRWVPTQNSGVGHVHFMFFVLISFALGSQRKPSFQWNMGFKPIFHCNAKPLVLGHCVGLDPPTQLVCIGDTNMLVSKMPMQGLAHQMRGLAHPT